MIINKEKTQEHWLELENDDGEFIASVKWDGCITYNPGEISPAQYTHICDLNRWIKELIEIKQQAIKHFGDRWPD